MEDIFGQIECRTKSDSIVMRILRSAMDEAHKKLQSKDGPIQFLHDRSTFYELAAILVEGGLNIVQEEKTDITEENCNKILSDLNEIKSWLQGRIRDMEQLIVEKDRESRERLENESRLQQSLELKEREISYLHEKLEPGRAKDDEDIFKLKSSVDQQVSNIKQKLEDGKKIFNLERRNKKTRVSSPNLSFDFLDKERTGSPVFTENESDRLNPNNQNLLIRKMSLDIDILKETLDLAFGRMKSFETSPLEKQWRFSVEKDVESILVKGFVSDLRQSSDLDSRNKVRFLNNDLFEFVDEMRNLCYELKNFLNINEVHDKGSTVLRSSSEPVSDIEYSEKNNLESIIHKQIEELNRMKREEGSFFREDNNGLERRIQDVITRLDNIKKRDQLENSRISNSDVRNKVESLEIEIEKLKEERDGLFFRISVMDDTYSLIFKQCKNFLEESLLRQDEKITVSLLTGDIYMILFGEMVKAWQLEKDACALQSLIREDIYQFVVMESVKDSRQSEAVKTNVLQEYTPCSRRLKSDGDESLIQKIEPLLRSEDLKVNYERDQVSEWVRSDDVLAIILQFEEALGNVENMLHENVESKCFRLDGLKREVDTLMKHVALIKKRKLLYEKAFLSRCHNLKLAETEVDLLGDQVESLLSLLERIYFELSRNSKTLSGYFEVHDVLKLISKELNNGRSFIPKS